MLECQLTLHTSALEFFLSMTKLTLLKSVYCQECDKCDRDRAEI